MTLITKRISGIEYLYYQDNVKLDKKNKVVSTFIGRRDLEGPDLKKAKIEALFRHMTNIYKVASLIENVPYHSERVPIDNSTFEYIKLCYTIMTKSMLPQEIQEFEQDIFVRYVHGSTSIEGNTLSVGETYSVLIYNLTPKNKPVNEVVEVRNYKKAKDYLDAYNGNINTTLIKTIHKIIMNNVLENGQKIEIGKFRATPRGIRGVKHSRPGMIASHIQELNEWYENSIKNNVHPIEIASIYHHRFEQIHPFYDGNGRVGRALLDLILKKNGFPTIYITKNERSLYLNALHEGDFGNYEPLIKLVIERILWTFSKLFVKTELYKMLQSRQLEELYTIFSDSETYQTILEQLKNLEKSED
jgi:Fic family protein